MTDERVKSNKGWNDGLKAAADFFSQTPVDMVEDLGDAYDTAFEQLPDTEITYTDREYNFSFVEAFVEYWKEQRKEDVLGDADITLDDMP